jgi:hypothetical protein
MKMKTKTTTKYKISLNPEEQNFTGLTAYGVTVTVTEATSNKATRDKRANRQKSKLAEGSQEGEKGRGKYKC